MTIDEAAQLTAREVLTKIGQEFNKLREDNKVKALKMYQRRLMENMGILCEVMTPKDITEICMKIEDSIKTESGSGVGSAMDEVSRFLGESPLVH
jgi:hypothetical protein